MNVELASKVLNFIKKHPEVWKQESWAEKNSCGTAFCFAGHVVNAVHGPDIFTWSNYSSVFSEETALTVNIVNDYGYRKSVADEAQQLLGISEPDAYRLFRASNTLEDIEQILQELQHDNV